MAEGNGVDLGSIYGLLVDVAETVSRHDAVLEQIVAKQDAMLQLLQQHEQRLTSIEARLADTATRAEVEEIRRIVVNIEGSLIAQGLLTSELNARVRHIEQHLDLPPFIHG